MELTVFCCHQCKIAGTPEALKEKGCKHQPNSARIWFTPEVAYGRLMLQAISLPKSLVSDNKTTVDVLLDAAVTRYAL